MLKRNMHKKTAHARIRQLGAVGYISALVIITICSDKYVSLRQHEEESKKIKVETIRTVTSEEFTTPYAGVTAKINDVLLNAQKESKELQETTKNNDLSTTASPKPEEAVKITSEKEEPKEEPKKEYQYYYVKDGKHTFYLDHKYQDYLYSKLKKHNHTDLYTLCLALMYHESRFTVNIVSKTNDHGLMQINGGNSNWLKKELGISSLDDPYDNIDCGVHIICKLVDKYKDVETALVCYNRGEGNKAPTSSYSRGVLADMKKLVQENK